MYIYCPVLCWCCRVCVCVNCMYHLLSNYMSLCVVHSCMHAKWHNNPLLLLSPVIEACPSYVPTLYGCIYSWLHNSVCQFRVCPYAHTHTHAHTCRGSSPVNGPVNFSAFSGFSLVCVCVCDKSSYVATANAFHACVPVDFANMSQTHFSICHQKTTSFDGAVNVFRRQT